MTDAMDAPATSSTRTAARPRLAGESDEERLAYLRNLLAKDQARAADCLEFMQLLLLTRWPREGER